MRLREIIFLSLIYIILIYPLSARAQVPTPAEIHRAVTVEEVRQFIDEYKARFVKMDLDAFMELFSKDAVENKMIPYSDIREAYRSTIAHSKSIIYNLKIYSIQTYPRSAFVMGRYEIIQTLKKGGKERIFQGDIQWNIVRENSSLKIREVNYGGLVKSLKVRFFVIPAQAGIQCFQVVRIIWIPVFTGMTTFYDSINYGRDR